MEIKLPELQATFKQLKQDSQAMANPQVRTAVEQLEEMLSELELKSPSAAPDTLFDPHVHMKDLERLMSFIPDIFDASPHQESLLQFLLKGASTYRGMGELDLPREGAHVYTNLAMAYVDAEEWEAAGACYAEATALAEQSGNLLTLSGIYINRAEFLLNITSIDAAQLYCDKALEVFQRSNDILGIAEAYKFYGCIHRHRGEWEAATDAFTQSIQRYQSCRNPQGEAEGCYEFGLMYQACQDSPQARYFLQRARSLYEQLEATDEIKRVEAALTGISVQTKVTGVQGDNAGVTQV